MFLCEDCQDTFKEDTNLKEHRNLVHIKIGTHPLCEECQNTLKEETSLMKHGKLIHVGMGAHSSKQPLCDNCQNNSKEEKNNSEHGRQNHVLPITWNMGNMRGGRQTLDSIGKSQIAQPSPKSSQGKASINIQSISPYPISNLAHEQFTIKQPKSIPCSNPTNGHAQTLSSSMLPARSRSKHPTHPNQTQPNPTQKDLTNFKATQPETTQLNSTQTEKVQFDLIQLNIIENTPKPTQPNLHFSYLNNIKHGGNSIPKHSLIAWHKNNSIDRTTHQSLPILSFSKKHPHTNQLDTLFKLGITFSYLQSNMTVFYQLLAVATMSFYLLHP